MMVTYFDGKSPYDSARFIIWEVQIMEPWIGYISVCIYWLHHSTIIHCASIVYDGDFFDGKSPYEFAIFIIWEVQMEPWIGYISVCVYWLHHSTIIHCASIVYDGDFFDGKSPYDFSIFIIWEVQMEPWIGYIFDCVYRLPSIGNHSLRIYSLWWWLFSR
jgi:hypothetical protein